MISDWGIIGVYLGLAVVIVLAIIGGANLITVVTQTHSDGEKLSAYECGFDPFEDARSEFDVRFYIVAILLIVFDLEASFLFPWAISMEGYWFMVDFVVELSVGLVYAWYRGVI